METVSEALKKSRMALTPTPLRSLMAVDGIVLVPPNHGARTIKEEEVCRYLLDEPELAGKYAERLAELPFLDSFLDRLRGELLNVAASGSSLEKAGLEAHLIRCGMADTLQRLKAHVVRGEMGEGSPSGEDADARFLRAASQLRDMAEPDPETGNSLGSY
jgi:DNA primase